MYSVAWFKMRF